jgi:YrbI family 3-deoxy-D-manno-octulosonate 8-phosphate phosphatase
VPKLNFSTLNLHALVSDFDGVFTDNKVYVDTIGNELVSCSKADSLGIDFYQKSKRKGEIGFDFIVLSTEKNSVVAARCSKLQLECHPGVEDKAKFLLKKYNSQLNNNGILEGIFYLGNDLNDLSAIKLSEFSAAPKDAHPLILKSVDFVSKNNGGAGFIREILENLIDFSY